MTKQLDLGMMIGYWGAGPPVGTPELIAEAERSSMVSNSIARGVPVAVRRS